MSLAAGEKGGLFLSWGWGWEGPHCWPWLAAEAEWYFLWSVEYCFLFPTA